MTASFLPLHDSFIFAREDTMPPTPCKLPFCCRVFGDAAPQADATDFVIRKCAARAGAKGMVLFTTSYRRAIFAESGRNEPSCPGDRQSIHSVRDMEGFDSLSRVDNSSGLSRM
jgi:hypothetical protein